MKKILVLAFAMVMSVNCRAQTGIGEGLALIEFFYGCFKLGYNVGEFIFSSPHDDCLKKGIRYYEAEDYEKAKDLLYEIDNTDLDFIQVLGFYYCGACHFSLEEYKQAYAEFNKVIYFETSWNTVKKDIIADVQSNSRTLQKVSLVMSLQSPHSIDVADGLFTLKENFDHATAFKCFSQVNETDKPLLRVMAHYYKGECRLYQDEYDKALINYRRAVNYKVPNNAEYKDIIEYYQWEAQSAIEVIPLLRND